MVDTVGRCTWAMVLPLPPESAVVAEDAIVDTAGCCLERAEVAEDVVVENTPERAMFRGRLWEMDECLAAVVSADPVIEALFFLFFWGLAAPLLDSSSHDDESVHMCLSTTKGSASPSWGDSELGLLTSSDSFGSGSEGAL